MKHLKIYEKWESGQVEESKTSNAKYHEGFSGKWSCIQGGEFLPYDIDGDGIYEVIMKGNTSYFPFGKSVTYNPQKSKHDQTTWGCENGKVKDGWRKNSKFKTYDPKNAWVKKGLQTYLPLNITDKGSNGNMVTQMQQKLIDLGFLKIPKPTGNYGVMTQAAIIDFCKGYNPGQETNQSLGITKDVYDQLLKAQKK